MSATGYRNATARYARTAMGERTSLRVLRWEGPLPVAGDLLQTSTYRTYLIEGLRPRKCGRAIFTLLVRVVPSTLERPPETRIFRWRWQLRKRTK